MNNRDLPFLAVVQRLLWMFACFQNLVLSLPVSSKNLDLDLAPASIIWSPEISRQLFSPIRTLNVLPDTTINIVCPNRGNAPKLREDKMYENIWFVDKKGFDDCAVNASKHKMLPHCNRPSDLKIAPIQFLTRDIPGRFRYIPGKTYYIIATTNGSRSSLNNTAGGNCLGQNMKIAFYVCRNEIDPKCLTKPAKPRARGCNTDKPKRMKKVFGKIEFLSHMLNNSSKQLADLMDHSNDMESKIDAILDNLNSTRPGIRRDVVLTLKNVELKKADEEKI